jgi:prepilin signal peptidase PulO-like enzyme (type II secretory pathway)
MAEFLSILLSLSFFALGSWFDLKTREVSDKVWWAYAPLGLVLSAYRLTANQSLLFLTLVSIGLTTLLSLGLFYFGLFGGADSKAIICLGLTLPLVPAGLQPVTGYAHPFFPLVVVIMGFLCSASTAVWLALRNLLTYSTGQRMFEGLEHESVWRKVLASITGYPTSVLKLHETFYLYPMEKVVEDPNGSRRTFQLFVNVEADRDALVSELDKSLPKVGSPGKIWVTPGLPMLLFILIGLIVTLILGDPIFTGVLMLARR